MLNSLVSKARKAIDDFNLINENDKIAVGLSGGKDSLTLLSILASLQRFYPKKFELCAITVDMGFPDTDKKRLEALTELCNSLKMPHYIEKTEIADIIFNIRKEKNPCSLCAKMRRGALNNLALSKGFDKLALGHHKDDLNETFFLSLFYESRINSFKPMSFMDKSGVTLIRPMLYITEKEIAAFAKDLPVLHNPCPANKNTRREYVKKLLSDLEKDMPFVNNRINAAILKYFEGISNR